MHTGSKLDFEAIRTNKKIVLKNYWKQRLGSCEPEAYLKGCYCTARLNGSLGHLKYGKAFSEGMFMKLHHLAPSSEAKQIVLFAVLGFLLQKFAGLSEVMIFSPTSQQNNLADKTIVPIKISFHAQMSVKDFLLEVKSLLYRDFRHANLPIEKILEVDEKVLKEIPAIGMLVDEPDEISVFGKLFPECIFSFRLGASLTLQLLYDPNKFKQSSIVRLVDLYSNLLKSVLKNTDSRLGSIKLVSKKEEHRILHHFNNTKIDYPAGETIISLFESQVKRTPKKTAVKFGEYSMTYEELNHRSNQIGCYLTKERGVRVGDLVGVMLQREEQLIPVIYGILKAGAAYVPLDTALPEERIDGIITDAKLRCLISRSRHLNPAFLHQNILLDLDTAGLPEPNKSCSGVSLSSKDLAYVIYTSGTTGKPKGVMVEHGSVINRILWMQRRYPVGEGDVLIQKTPVTFDVSVWEIFWWAFCGASLCLLAPEKEKDPKEVAYAIQKYGVTVIHFVPSMLVIFLDILNNQRVLTALKTLRIVFVSGEALKPKHVTAFGRTLFEAHHTRLINLYGPTEATVDVSYFECKFNKDYKDIPIGRPIDNIRLYVVDRSLALLPIGMVGELVIAGVGVARGYLNNVPLTKEKFATLDYLNDERVYKTGDMVRWRTDGNLQYLGRTDHQVKIRGYRIELGEIESHLMKHPLIRESVVVVKEDDNDKSLVAYYVAAKEIAAARLKEFLLGKLPPYMIPLHFVAIDAIPLTMHGKLDRKVLPQPVIGVDVHYVEPQDLIAKKLAEIWSGILNVDKNEIGIHHNFFNLGGQSIKAARLAQSIEQNFSIEIGLKKIFDCPTIDEQAHLIRESHTTTLHAISKAGDQPYYSTSSAQERLFCAQLLNKDELVNNCYYVYDVEGELDLRKLKNTFRLLLERHSGLRANFFLSGEQVLQRIRKSTDIQIEMFEPEQQGNVEHVLDRFVRPFDLSNDLLLRVGILVSGSQRCFLFVDIHHIVCDGVSINILMNDFKRIYEGRELSPSILEYVDYACWQRNASAGLQKERSYWVKQLSGDIPKIELPRLPNPDSSNRNSEGSNMLVINNRLYTSIKHLAAQMNGTPFMVLISAYYVLISKLSGSSDIIIGTDAIGRTRASLMEIVGTFVNVLPLRIQVDSYLSFIDLIKEVRQVVLSASENQELPYDEMLQLIGNSAANGIVNIYFSNADFFRNELESSAIKISPVNLKARSKPSRYELELNMQEHDANLNITFRYNADLFDSGTIGLFMQYYLDIVKMIVSKPSFRLKNVRLDQQVMVS